MQLASRRTNPLALISAMCLFLSTIEFMVPKPLPFMRIGLANLPILIATEVMGPTHFLLVIVMKVAGQAMIRGTLFSYVFLLSACSSFGSGLVMYTARRALGRRISLVGVSILGALASNSLQIWLAGLLAFGSNAILVAPPLILFGTLSATVLGWFAERFTQESVWFARFCDNYGRRP